MQILLLTSCLAVTILIGWSLLNIIFYKKSSPFCLPEKLALSYGLGLGAITFQLFIYYFFKIRFNVLNITAFWIPVFILGLFFAKSTLAPLDKSKEKLSLFEKFLLYGISIELFLAFFRAFLRPLESYDSIAMYAMRAKIIFLNGAIPPNFFNEISLNYPHPDYPLLIPLAEAWVYTFLGNLNDLLVKIIFPIYFLSILVIFFFLLKRLTSRKPALLFTFLLASIPQFNHYATIGYTDSALGYYYFVGTVFLYLWMREKNTRFLILSAVFTFFAVWTKNEGIVLCLINFILLFLFLAFNFKKRLFKHTLIFTMIIIVLSAPWIITKFTMDLDNNYMQFSNLSLERFSSMFNRPDRLRLILYEYQKQFLGPKKWNIFWIVFFVIFIINFRRSFFGYQKYLILPVFLAMLFYGSVYLFVTVKGYIGWQISMALNRLLIHFTSVACFYIAIMCHERKLIEE